VAGVPQRQIGAVLGLDPSAVVALVDDLESLGLVQRQPDPDDRRTRLVSPTPAGLTMLEKVSPVVGRVQERSMGGLTAAERDTFVRLLRRVVNE
jgi:DNA-binding MarR family transcriptional regulator